ncbi:TAFII55 protein conserved region domain-containing protein [Neurospora intermedia]|uniref:TAFII55 protein conserved region domain-containing protein n=1 Tax=Neurospora intermedia TaxID=5142 RepID=A0ABR3DNQ9_NEUIN
MDPPGPPKRTLTLKINTQSNGSSQAGRTGSPAVTPGPGHNLSAASPPPQTPGGSQGPRKIKLNVKGTSSQPPTPAGPRPPSHFNTSSQPTQPRISTGGSAAPNIFMSKPKTASKVFLNAAARKRQREESEAEDGPTANGIGGESRPKKITLKAPSGATPVQTPLLAPKVRLKSQGKIPTRPLGEGYDSEADDREVDPVIEEQLILRMMPGEHCDYLRKAVAERKVGVPKHQGGADVTMKFLDEEGRRVMFVIQGQPYAAILVDLPTITEGMKTWDKKSMVKSADICQMILVFAKVKDEAEAKSVPLPKAVEHGHRWPHGITPPMHDARNRRFRKRLSKLEIQNKEAEVERLLAADREALNSRYELVAEGGHGNTAAPESDHEYGDEDGGMGGEEDRLEDYFGDANVQNQDDDNLFDDLEAEFENAADTPAEAMDAMDFGAATPTAIGGGMDLPTPPTANTGTPTAAQTEESAAEAVSEEDESDEDDEDDEGDMDDDGDEERHDEVAGVKAEIATLRKQLASYEEQLSKAISIIMKKRLEGSIKNIKSEIKLKQSSIGEVSEED